MVRLFVSLEKSTKEHDHCRYPYKKYFLLLALQKDVLTSVKIRGNGRMLVVDDFQGFFGHFVRDDIN